MCHSGIEPLTFWLKVKCSTNWANGTWCESIRLCLSIVISQLILEKLRNGSDWLPFLAKLGIGGFQLFVYIRFILLTIYGIFCRIIDASNCPTSLFWLDKDGKRRFWVTSGWWHPVLIDTLATKGGWYRSDFLWITNFYISYWHCKWCNCYILSQISW